MTTSTDSSSLNAAIGERFFGLKTPVTAYAWNDRKKREQPYHVYRTRGTSRDRGTLTNGWSEVIHGGYATLITETGEKLTRYYTPRQYDQVDGLALKALGTVLSLVWGLTVEIRSVRRENLPIGWTVQFSYQGNKQRFHYHDDSLAQAIVAAIHDLPPTVQVSES